MTDKYKAAIVEYRAANLAIRSLTTEIGKHLEACAAKRPDDTDPKSPHLSEAYSVDSDEYGRFPAYADPAEDYLIDACPHCYEAHKLIQERKDARKRFGIAKRRLMSLGAALE